ncbi:large conductance mechanosensitive channel protein MscL [Pseudolysinimonas kribbensis]|jgi:large conductance mechanosensitive channel|uniref:Large-conductance mechanosensitive channel n=1 Tax=Pseudolysinimonas kribbensis TaxID=433641 RepID=A0ABQ6K7J0_9MICO|nr:large conductance mechanosensitive channel protein MscL [Pseudolysinimonas kribbensis]GMA95932.1 large conductance mechanosensitive channel protein MscL [Pseudolysinimonas kribbensis]
MLKGFREFVLRGNVIDLAVAVVIGAAFTAIVTGLVTGIFNPLISLIFDSSDVAKAGIVLRAASPGHEAVVLAWGAVISAIIQFVLIAAAVYFGLIVPMNYLKKVQLRKKPAEEAPATPALTETELLVQIRDLLKERDPGTPAQ